MPIQQPTTLWRDIPSLIWAICLSLLLLGIPLTFYTKSTANVIDRGFVNQLDPLTLHASSFRIGLKHENQLDADNNDSPKDIQHWAIFSAAFSPDVTSAYALSIADISHIFVQQIISISTAPRGPPLA